MRFAEYVISVLPYVFYNFETARVSGGVNVRRRTREGQLLRKFGDAVVA
jgi:hypothetical protein